MTKKIPFVRARERKKLKIFCKHTLDTLDTLDTYTAAWCFFCQDYHISIYHSHDKKQPPYAREMVQKQDVESSRVYNSGFFDMFRVGE